MQESLSYVLLAQSQHLRQEAQTSGELWPVWRIHPPEAQAASPMGSPAMTRSRLANLDQRRDHGGPVGDDDLVGSRRQRAQQRGPPVPIGITLGAGRQPEDI